MKKESVAAGGAIGASLLIASCCVAPTLFLLFGVSVGTLGFLGSLEPYRPIFIALGGAALAYAAWRAWRPAAGAECAGETCAADSASRRRTRGLIIAALILYGIAISYPYALEALL
jgi:mercuric ion transport protein